MRTRVSTLLLACGCGLGSTSLDTPSGAPTSSTSADPSELGSDGGSTAGSSSTGSPAPDDDDDPPAPERDLPTGACSPLLPDSCPRGTKCRGNPTWSAEPESLACVPVLGDGAPGDPCTADWALGLDDCDASSVCLWTSETDVGTCASVCDLDDDPSGCPEGDSCLYLGSDNIGVCGFACDPTAPDCPPLLPNCQYEGSSEGFLCMPLWYGNLPNQGEPCTEQCSPGALCIWTPGLSCGYETWGCCATACDLGGDVPCDDPGSVCAPYFQLGKAPEHLDHVGFCVPP